MPKSHCRLSKMLVYLRGHRDAMPLLHATLHQEYISFSDEGPLLRMLEFFEISYCNYQPLNVLPYSHV